MPVGAFHHVGFVVASIADIAQSFAKSIDAEWDGHIIYDPHQIVQVTFLRSRSAADPLFELIEPAGQGSPVLSFLQKYGGGLHHVCYVVDDLDKELQGSRSKGNLVVRQPAPATAFGGRRIAWVYTKTRLVIEYLEKGGVAQQGSHDGRSGQ